MSGRRSSGALDILLMTMLQANQQLSGYQLSMFLREPVPLIWPVKHSQIYPALSALEAKGDIVGGWVEQVGRPNKRIYALSTAGRQRLVDWLQEPRATMSQDEIMLITYNISLIGADAVRAALQLYRGQCIAEKAQLEARWVRALPDQNDHWSIPLDVPLMLTGVRTVYEFALSARDARIAWCETVLERAEAAALHLIDRAAVDRTHP